MARKVRAAGKAPLCPPRWRFNLGQIKWNKIIYDRIKEVEKGQESTKTQKPLRLGTKKTFRKKFRSFRVRVRRLRLRIKITPLMWLRKLCDAYVSMMMGLSDRIGSGGIVVGFHGVYPMREPGRMRPIYG